MAELKITEKFNEMLGEGYKKIKHKSGLEIYIIPKELKTSYALFATKYGSCMTKFKLDNEKTYTNIPDGTAHFLEHKMFENEDGVDTFSKFGRFGGDANAFTSGDRTAYLFSCTSNEHENLEVLLTFVTSPYFTPENIAKEQGIIGQEIKMYDDDADWQLYFGALQGMYKSNTVRVDTAGTAETIGTLDKDMLYKCYNTFYDASNMYLVLCGKFDAEKVALLCDKIVPASKKPKVTLPEISEPVKANKKKTEKKLNVSRTLFTIGIKDPNTENTGKAGLKKSIATSILAECLFGIGSDFYCENYKSGLINETFGTSKEISYAYSHLLISGESDNPEKVLEKVKKLMEKTVEKGVSKADFERCKRVVYAKSIVVFEKSEVLANMFLDSLLLSYDLLDLPGTVSSAKLADVNARAKELFNPDAITLSIVKPNSK